MNSQKRAQICLTVVLMLTLTLLAGLVVRVGWMQWHVTRDDNERVVRQYTARQTLETTRAPIRLCEGTEVACSVRMYNLYADPTFIDDPEGMHEQIAKLRAELAGVTPEKQARIESQIQSLEAKLDAAEPKTEAAKGLLAEALGPLLNKSAEEVRALLQANASYPSGRARRFLWLIRDVDEAFYDRFQALREARREEARQLAREARELKKGHEAERAAKLEHAKLLSHCLDGVGFIKSTRRVYPLGPLAASVVGYANNYEGVDGLEHQLDDLLRGRLGQMQLVKDAARRTVLIQDQGFRPADNGCAVWLTIDPVIQHIAEEELANACTQFKAESGCAIIMDPFTGKIVAMANHPTFDPSNYQAAAPDTRINKCIVFPYEPGSIFKPFVAAWAIEKGVVRPADIINCHGGHWSDPTGRAVTDVHGYGALSVEDVLVKSSNIGMAQIGWKMGIPALHEAVTRFGFGQRTGVELPGDSKGIVRPLGVWNKGTLTSVSFGYEVAATPLQLVRGYAAFANGGYLVTPQVLHAVEIAPGRAPRWEELAGTAVEKQIISAQTAMTMRNIMEGVFTRGTAKKAGSKYYRLFGKTGTAHLAVRGAGHYAGDQYNSSFLAGGPMSSPRLVAVVTLHKPDRALGHFGGTVAAPACSQMLERSLQYLQVTPDQTAENVRGMQAAN